MIVGIKVLAICIDPHQQPPVKGKNKPTLVITPLGENWRLGKDIWRTEKAALKALLKRIDAEIKKARRSFNSVKKQLAKV